MRTSQHVDFVRIASNVQELFLHLYPTGLFNSIVARRLSKEARERLRAPRGKKGKNRGLGFMYQEFGAFFPNPSVRMPLYCLYRLLCTTYVHVVCVLMAHVLRWWWWIEASGVESLLGEAIVRRAWDFLPGFARRAMHCYLMRCRHQKAWLCAC